MKAVKAKLDPDPKSEKVKTFEKAAGAYFTKKILPKLKEQSLDFVGTSHYLGDININTAYSTLENR